MKKISVIMASYLGEYKGCANDREEKFVRAVNSFLTSNYPEKELIVIGDCCEITAKLITRTDWIKPIMKGQIVFYNFPKKQKLFSGKIRNKGLELATGDYICYLDSDDMFGDTHLDAIVSQMESEEHDWCYYNDFIKTEKGLIPKEVELTHGSIGTSSIAHINHPSISWKKCNGYGHDYKFIKRLQKWSDFYEKIYGCAYIICHIPNQVDS